MSRNVESTLGFCAKRGVSDDDASFTPATDASRAGERGYTLVALLALMTILALALTAAAPSIHQQKQRDLEREAVARGEEVAEAIAQYMRVKRVPPTSMDQLLEGLAYGTKKVQILRPSAAIDPLSSTGEWRLVRSRSSEISSFQQAVMLYSGGSPPPLSKDGTLAQLLQPHVAAILGIVDTGKKEEAPGGEDDSTNATGPFIGVASRSRRDSVITYYGIERHDKWVFTPLFR
ncbi:MAG TPA: hypothetical protein VM866_10410 [Pyrinomonadaceae bacterium]|jgi:type II secretory pathway pseudopilin PulG|nr:hypothetical protein [Pyrinomonadaceae bacterium]